MQVLKKGSSLVCLVAEMKMLKKKLLYECLLFTFNHYLLYGKYRTRSFISEISLVRFHIHHQLVRESRTRALYMN